jgi:phenylacetate-CoA ligase
VLLREHLWHDRRPSRRLASITRRVADGPSPGWGPSTDRVFPAASSLGLNFRHPVEAQVAWLEREDPAHLLTRPRAAHDILRHCRAHGIRLPGLREVRVYGEPLRPDLATLCQEVLGVPLHDAYSAEELGCIATECPEEGRYHVTAEAVLLEILDTQGHPCGPGETGRVVATALHNFQTPLIRYELGDVVVAGRGCSCGRGLPTIERVLGRPRNRLDRPDGSVGWPRLDARLWEVTPALVDAQMVQVASDGVELRVVLRAALGPSEREGLCRLAREILGPGLRVEVVTVERLPRHGIYHKIEDFVRAG